MPLCIALRRYGFIYNFKIISNYSNEVDALLAQISEIEKEPELNEGIGGHGLNYNIVEKKWQW